MLKITIGIRPPWVYNNIIIVVDNLSLSYQIFIILDLTKINIMILRDL